MPPVTCPNCDARIPPENVNIAEAVAHCAICGEISRLPHIIDKSELQQSTSDDDLTDPPEGCRITYDGVTTTIIARIQPQAGAKGSLVVVLVWNAFSIATIVAAILFPWTSTKPQGSSNRSVFYINPPLFALFVLLGILLFAGALAANFGEYRVLISRARGTISFGVGWIRLSRRFDASTVESVEEQRVEARGRMPAYKRIVLNNGKPKRFGNMLTTEQRRWMCATLRDLLIAPR